MERVYLYGVWIRFRCRCVSLLAARGPLCQPSQCVPCRARRLQPAEMTASDGGLYKVLIVGGGPAGVGVFIRAARTGFMARLLNPALYGEASDRELSERVGMKQKGVAIVHDGGADNFGTGNLGKYIINSNTFARSLLSSVLDEKPELDPPESIKSTFLERAKDHETTRKLEEIGNSPACLVDFGRFLHTVGACLRDELALHSDTSKCLLNTRATRFERLESGIYRVEVTENNDRVFTLYTEHLVLAMGGKQELPPSVEATAQCKGKLFLSDECLREDGFARLRDYLVKSENRKVCIVGGSHSAFSVAWLLLNRDKKQRQKSLQLSAPPVSPVKSDSIVSADTGSEIEVRQPTAVVGAEPTIAMELTPAKSVAKPKPPPIVFQPRDITILHRSAIRCYYMTRKDAEADGADGSRVDRTGCVNTFTGLREDSKNLYKDIKAGKESHVRLFQVNQNGCQNLTMKAYESASAIVWCCGYSTRMIPGFDVDGSPFQFCMDHGVVKLDLQARVQLQLASKSAVPAPNLMGVGLGFSLQSHVDEMGTETRADGVTVYHRRGATLVLAALFGPEVFGAGSQSFEEMVEKNDKNRKKKDSPEPGLVERMRRPSSIGSHNVTSASKLSTDVVSSAQSPVTKTARAAPHHLQFSPDKKPAARPTHGLRQQQPPDHQLVSNNMPVPVTNPPAKMLLQRRRSAEALAGVAVLGRLRQTPSPSTKARNGSGSMPKLKILQGQRVAPVVASASQESTR